MTDFPSLTDTGNAQRLFERHGHFIRYVPRWKSWLLWDGKEGHWEVDNTGQITEMAKNTVRAMYREAADLSIDTQRSELVSHARRSEALSRIRAMIELAKSLGDIPAIPTQLDADPWLFNVANGTIDLRTGKLRPHDRLDLITQRAPVTYHVDASCPLWDTFLHRITGGDVTLVRYLQRIVGYALTGSIREQIVFIFYGTGANGKSVVVETLRGLLGDYGKQTDANTFLHFSTNPIRNDIARLAGARLVVAVEAGEGRRLNEVLIKQLTGGDRIAARFLYGEFFEFTPQFTPILVANNRPAVSGTDHAIWRRIRLVPFSVTIPPEEQDRELVVKLRSELSGILTWAVQGCLDWQRYGLEDPPSVHVATSQYKQEEDVLGRFLDDCCALDSEAHESAHDLWRAFQPWATANGESMTQTMFGRRLVEKGFAKRRRNIGGTRLIVYTGLTITAKGTQLPGLDVVSMKSLNIGSNDKKPEKTMTDRGTVAASPMPV